MQLTEIFDSKVDYTVTVNTNSRWIAKATIGKRDIEFAADQFHNNTWQVIFWERPSMPKNHKARIILRDPRTTHKTGSGNELQVGAMVIACLKELIETKHPDYIQFTADKEDGESRTKIYTRVLKRLKLPGYTVTSKELYNNEQAFIIAKNRLPSFWDDDGKFAHLSGDDMESDILAAGPGGNR